MKQPIALITGGTGGIGTAICQKLYRDGCKVVASYHKNGNHEAAQRWQNQQAQAGFEIHIAYGDVSDPESTKHMIQHVENTWGPIDVLVNNAGIAQDASLKKMSLDAWRRVLSTNLDSVFHACSQVIQGMIERGFGRIINMSSINGQKGQFGQCNYAAAKAGMHGFTKSLALEAARKGVTANTISPGYIETGMMAHVPQDILKAIINTIPVGRLGQPQEVADLVSFLARPTSGFITGAHFAVNGGQHMC